MEIIRQDDAVQCILPDQRVVLLETRKDVSPLVTALPSASPELDPHYEITLRGGASHTDAAGRKPPEMLN